MRTWSRKARWAVSILGIAAAIAAIFSLYALLSAPAEHPSYGVTFSPMYARSLGLDPRETFVALLDDMGVRRFRIPAYWSEIQPSEGEYRWDELDWLMSEAEARGAEVTLAIGYKVPRWPECYIPDWARTEDRTAFESDHLSEYLRAVVERYRASAALVRWQVENEPYLAFGECPKVDRGEISREVALVRSLDDHPIAMTVSGELERWGPMAGQSDVLGISMYRITWNSVIGYFRYPFPAAFYRLRAQLVGHLTDELYVSELQAEPWFPDSVENHSPAEWADNFTADDLRQNVEFARNTGIEKVDLWGAEWWYYLLKNDEADLWNEAELLFGQEP